MLKQLAMHKDHKMYILLFRKPLSQKLLSWKVMNKYPMGFYI